MKLYNQLLLQGPAGIILRLTIVSVQRGICAIIKVECCGMVEGINQTLKETLSKWILETDCSWVGSFLTALLRLGTTPRSHGYSPYEIVYGRPPPIIKQVSTNLPHVRGDGISQQMEQLGN